MPDGSDKRLAAIRAAADPSRWKLLAHAVDSGPFDATRAADIAGLPRESGNARSTHADGLCDVELLKRSDGLPVRYSATPEGIALFRTLQAIVDQSHPRLRSSSHRLAPGDELALSPSWAVTIERSAHDPLSSDSVAIHEESVRWRR